MMLAVQLLQRFAMLVFIVLVAAFVGLTFAFARWGSPDAEFY
jgi:hypothetical protein